MISRFFVFTFALSILLNLLPYSLAHGTPRSGKCHKPNIVFFLADDLGYADCGFNGGKDINTPAIDRLDQAGLSSTPFTFSLSALPQEPPSLQAAIPCGTDFKWM